MDKDDVARIGCGCDERSHSDGEPGARRRRGTGVVRRKNQKTFHGIHTHSEQDSKAQPDPEKEKAKTITNLITITLGIAKRDRVAATFP